MREIKFRAWVKNGYHGDRMIYLEDYDYLCLEDTAFCVHEEYSTVYEVLMQFTGLKDSNGCDIYEGDIVIRDDWWFTPAEVVFRQDGNEMYWHLKCATGSESWNLWDSGELKVIGNVYESPELLVRRTPGDTA